jgi:hypothetical protein
VLSVHDGTIHLTPIDIMIEEAQAVVRSHNPNGIALSELALADRRKEFGTTRKTSA